jgi:hypothetical protein
MLLVIYTYTNNVIFWRTEEEVSITECEGCSQLLHIDEVI